MPWAAVRLLYAGSSAVYRSSAEQEREADRQADPQGHRGKYLPLYRLPKHFESHTHGFRRDGEALGDGDQVQRGLHGQENAARGLRLSRRPQPFLPVAAGLSEHGNSGRQEFSGETQRGDFAHSRNGGGKDVAGGDAKPQSRRL